jgi:hypothetical protein
VSLSPRSARQPEGPPRGVARYADESILLAASRIKPARHLSFADALMAGFAVSHGAILVHKDPEFEALGAEVRQERLPYKPRRSGL